MAIPIGSLTSQIFVNIYLHEFDRFMVHQLKPAAYMRYGDDWLSFHTRGQALDPTRRLASYFLQAELKLTINPRLDHIDRTRRGISYLGVDFWPYLRRLNAHMRKQIDQRLSLRNFGTYQALLKLHGSPKSQQCFRWRGVG